jgi:hypothetical protein
MDQRPTDKVIGQAFALKSPEPVANSQEHSVQGGRRVKRRNLGSFIENEKKVNVWYENGQVIFRRRYSHRTEVASLQDIYHRVVGQTEFEM